MSDDSDLNDAIEFSLEQLKETIAREQEEKEELRRAIALSLGKPVEQLTVRDTLALTLDAPKKRVVSTDSDCASKRQNTGPKRYWDGEVKLTHVSGFTGPQYMAFEDIVLKNNLKKALITAMVCSLDWIETQFPKDANLCIVTFGRPAMAKQLGPKRIIIMPPMKDEKYGVFHPKLMLLFHEASLRVVIGSANLERYDYNDLENVVFIQDFPQVAQPTRFEALPQFARDIGDLLDQMQVPPSVKEELTHYDFSRAKAHIVASVSGDFEGKDHQRYGHARLAQVIRDIQANDPERKPTIEMQTSSLGSLTASYLHELYRSFCGIDPYADGKPLPRLKKDEPLPPISIVYPSVDTVMDSKLGPSGASTICLSSSAWKKNTFPKDVMCDAISYRPGTLMHSKYIVATLSPTEGASSDQLKGWIYCGSHNATVSAWGKLSLTKQSKQPKMSISNWELGVVLPVYDTTKIPIPYLRPPPRYSEGQDAWSQP